MATDGQSKGDTSSGITPTARRLKATKTVRKRTRSAENGEKEGESKLSHITVQARIDTKTLEFCEHVYRQENASDLPSEETRAGGFTNVRRAAKIGRLFLPLFDGTLTSSSEDAIGTLTQEQWVAQVLPAVLLAVRELERRGITVASISFEQLTRTAIAAGNALAETLTRNDRVFPLPREVSNPITGALGDPTKVRLGENMSHLMDGLGSDLE